jgi:ABC-type transporter Mla subunit MlaD
MTSGRLEFKVGLFVIVLLGLAAVMSIRFSKTGFGLMDETVSINLRTENAGTVIKNSPVLMSGVRVGYVDSVDLLKNQDGSVVVELGIQLFAEHEDKVLGQNSTFFIKSTGFLGDQYIGVNPGQGPPVRALLEKKGWLWCEKPFDIEETGQRVSKLLEHVDVAVMAITNFVGKIDQELLSDDTVTDLTMTISDFREISKSVKEKFDDNGSVSQGIENFNRGMTNFNAFSKQLRDAMRTNAPAVHESVTNFSAFTKRLHDSAGELELLISTNAPTMQKALGNIQAFSVKLDKTTADLQSTLANNRTNITQVVGNLAIATRNIKGITESVDKILMQVESGKGLAGGLITNEEMRLQFMAVMTNLNGTAVHFSNLASNLNARGIFYKPKPESLVIPPRSVRPK